MSELNDKIVTCIDSRGMRNFDRNAFQSFNAEEIEQAAKAIEILVLEEMRTLLGDCYFKDNNNNQVLQTEINVLNAKINQLKQQ